MQLENYLKVLPLHNLHYISYTSSTILPSKPTIHKILVLPMLLNHLINANMFKHVLLRPTSIPTLAKNITVNAVN